MNYNIQDINGQTLLMRKIMNEDYTDIDNMLCSPDINLDIKDNDGYTILMRACLACSYKLVHMIIDAGADLNLQNNFGFTALMISCFLVKQDGSIPIIE